MWRFITPEFESDFKVVTMDHVGAGASVLEAYDRDKYASLHGYADDLIEIGRELNINGGILVGHSVSAMIGALTVAKAPGMFDTLVMVSPSPRYIDDAGYVGGFSETEIEELLEAFEENPLAWSASMAPAIMGNPLTSRIWGKSCGRVFAAPIPTSPFISPASPSPRTTATIWRGSERGR